MTLLRKKKVTMIENIIAGLAVVAISWLFANAYRKIKYETTPQEKHLLARIAVSHAMELSFMVFSIFFLKFILNYGPSKWLFVFYASSLVLSVLDFNLASELPSKREIGRFVGSVTTLVFFGALMCIKLMA